MSETTSTATIRVVADASGVEAGLRPAVEAARNAGQAVSQIGDGAATSARNVEAAQRDITAAVQRTTTAMSQAGAGAAAPARNVEASQRNIIAAVQRTTLAMESGGRSTAAYYEALGRQRGIDANALAPYIAQLRAVEEAQTRAAAAAGHGSTQIGHVGLTAAQVNQELRFLPNRFQSIADSITAGQRPMTILIQQGGELVTSFGGIGAATRAVGGYLLGLINPYTIAASAAAALAYTYYAGSKEADGYRHAIALTGNAAGTSVGQLTDYARAISGTIGTQSEAAQALTELASTGQVGASNMLYFGTVALQVQKYIGRSAADTAKDLGELGKAPLEASVKLNDSYHYLTASVYNQIKALQDQGKTEEARETAQKAYASAFEGRANKMRDQLGLIERAWMDTKESASQAWDAFLGVGRKKSATQELAEIRAQIKLAQSAVPLSGGDRGDMAAMRQAAAAGQLPELRRKEREAQDKVNREAREAKEAAEAAKLEKATEAWDSILDSALTKVQRKKKEIDRVTNAAAAAKAPKAQLDAALRKIEQDYASIDNPALAQLEGQAKVEKTVLAGRLETLESHYKQQLISESDYISQKRDLQVQEINIEIGLAEKRRSLDKSKEDQSAYVKDIADVKALVQQRQNVINAATNAIDEARSERAKAVNDLVAGWDRAIAADTEAVAQDLALFGQSDQARQVAIAQIKLETEARKLIADQAKSGHALSAQEITDLMAKTDARKKETAARMNEKAAIAGAQQLLQENRKFAVEYIANADERAQRILDIDAQQWRELIANTEEGSEVRKKLIEQFDQWYANRQMTPVLERWKGVIDGLDNDFREGFRDMLSGGQNLWSSFAKSIGNTLKTSLATALYDTFIKKYVVQIVTGFAGAISGPAVAGALTGQANGSAGAAGGSSAIGTAMTMSNVYKLITSGFDKISTTVSGGIDSLLGQFGPGTIGSTGPSSLGSAGGTAASYGAGLLAGHYIGNAIAGDYSVNHGQAVTNIASVVGALAAGPLGAAIGGAIGGLFNRAFGMGDKKVTDQGISGTLSAGALTGNSYSTWHQDGGWFRSDRNGTDTTALTAAMVAQFTQGLGAIETASSGFAKSLGVSADWVSTYSKTFDLKLTGDASKDQQLVVDFFNGIGDEIANKLVPNLATFSKSGETASATLERLAGDFQATDQVAQLIGKTAANAFGSVGIESAKAREQLVSLAGSASTLTSQAQSYAQNYLTDAQRLAPVKTAVEAAMASLGLASVQTRDQFKAIVDSLDLTTEAGAKEFTSLMALNDAFAQVYPSTTAASDALAQVNKGYQDQIDELVKATMSAADVRAMEIAGMDASTVALYDRLDALKREASVAQERKTLQDQVDDLTLTAAQQLAKQRDALDASNQSLFDQVQALKAQAGAIQAVKDSASSLLGGVDGAFSVLQKVVGREKDLLQARIEAEGKVITRLQGFSDSIRSTLDSIQAPGTEAATRQAAQAQIKGALAAVRGGASLTDAQITSLQKAFSVVTKDSSGLFSSREAYLSDLYQTQNDIAALGDATDNQLSTEQASLKQLQAQSDYLDGILQAAQDQVDELKGVSTNGLTLVQAMDGLAKSIAVAKENPVVSSSSAINNAYQQYLGRAPDQTGFDWWQNAAAGGTPISQIVDGIKGSTEATLTQLYQSVLGRAPDASGLAYWVNAFGPTMDANETADWMDAAKRDPGYKGLPSFDVGTNSVEYDTLAMVHKGERIMPAADNRALMARLASPAGNSAALAEALKTMTETATKQQEVIETMAEQIESMQKVLSGSSPGGNYIRVKVMP